MSDLKQALAPEALLAERVVGREAIYRVAWGSVFTPMVVVTVRDVVEILEVELLSDHCPSPEQLRVGPQSVRTRETPHVGWHERQFVAPEAAIRVRDALDQVAPSTLEPPPDEGGAMAA